MHAHQQPYQLTCLLKQRPMLKYICGARAVRGYSISRGKYTILAPQILHIGAAEYQKINPP